MIDDLKGQNVRVAKAAKAYLAAVTYYAREIAAIAEDPTSDECSMGIYDYYGCVLKRSLCGAFDAIRIIAEKFLDAKVAAT